MDGTIHSLAAAVDVADLGRLMPMHLWVSPTGHIRSVGPTLCKLIDDAEPGRRFLEIFAVKKPRCAQSMKDFNDMVGQRLHICLRQNPRTRWRGLAVRLQDGQGILINLSFGISAADAVREHALTHADFAPTDLTVELLYLTEVKAAVMTELSGMNQRLKLAQCAAEEQALTDTLTGLANRRALDAALNSAISAAARGGHPFALMHVDLDYFKAVNDNLGHAAGDRVLAHVAHVLKAIIRDYDVAARVGGDEFVLIFHDLTDEIKIGDLTARLIEALEKPVDFKGQECRISGSIGVTLSTFYKTLDADRMLCDADDALYASKRGGRGRWTLHGREMPCVGTERPPVDKAICDGSEPPQ